MRGTPAGMMTSSAPLSAPASSSGPVCALTCVCCEAVLCRSPPGPACMHACTHNACMRVHCGLPYSTRRLHARLRPCNARACVRACKRAHLHWRVAVRDVRAHACHAHDVIQRQLSHQLVHLRADVRASVGCSERFATHTACMPSAPRTTPRQAPSATPQGQTERGWRWRHALRPHAPCVRVRAAQLRRRTHLEQQRQGLPDAAPCAQQRDLPRLHADCDGTPTARPGGDSTGRA